MSEYNPQHRIDVIGLSMTEIKYVESWPVTIFIAGDLNKARDICREYCMRVGLCVTVEPTEYIYTGGAEQGVRVGLINYPRFPKDKKEIEATAVDLMYELMYGLHQQSATVQTPSATAWYSRRPKESVA